ncbi:unnamed protein product [Ixodes persulcatus]
MPPEMAQKWSSVIDVLLFQKLRDDVDDTLVQKLITFLDATDDQEFLGCLLSISSEKLATTLESAKTPSSLAFGLHLTAALGRREQLFRSLGQNGVLTALEKLDISGQEASVRSALLHALTAFLQHESGVTWAARQGALDRVLPSLLDPSVFVQNKAEAFCVAYLSGNIDAPKAGQFLDTTLGEAHLKRRKRCLRILLAVMKRSKEAVSALCRDHSLETRLASLVGQASTTEEELCLAAQLAALLSRAGGGPTLTDSLALFKRSPAARVKFAAAFIESGADVEEEKRCVELLVSGLDDPSRSVVSSSLGELRQVMPRLAHPATLERVAEGTFRFLGHSRWARQSRLLAVALECFGMALAGTDLVAAGSEKLEAYLVGLMSVPSNDSLTTHALQELLGSGVTLAVALSGCVASDTEWSSSAGLTRLGEALRRHMVSTEPLATEAALEALAGLANVQSELGAVRADRMCQWLELHALPRFLWGCLDCTDGGVRAAALSALARLCLQPQLCQLLQSTLQLSQSEVVERVAQTARNDADVFARRAAMATLSLWVGRDCLAPDCRSAARRSASRAVARDLDSEVQLSGLATWRTCLDADLDALAERTEASARQALGKADADGLGSAVESVLCTDSDARVRSETERLLRDLRDRLTREFAFSASGNGSAFPYRRRGHGESRTYLAFGDEPALDRGEVMDQVLDLGLSECLLRKLRPSEDIRTSEEIPGCGPTPATPVTTESMLGYVSEGLPRKPCGTVLFDETQSLLDDLLAAADSTHRDMDCY